MDNYQSKKEAVLGFLNKGMTMLHLDARKAGVLVPDAFKGQADLRLNLSYRFPNAKIEIVGDTLSATLTFSGEAFRCHIPLDAIYALTHHLSHVGMVFPESLPEELLEKTESPQPEQKEEQKISPIEQAVVGNYSEQVSVTHNPIDLPGKPTRAPYLRVIEGEKKN